MKRLERKRYNRVFAGVAAGLGAYFGIDPRVFRLMFVALSFFHGLGFILYVIAALLLPMEPLRTSDFGSFFSQFFTNEENFRQDDSRHANYERIYDKDAAPKSRRPRKDVTPK